jgi:hypothetical protein
MAEKIVGKLMLENFGRHEHLADRVTTEDK